MRIKQLEVPAFGPFTDFELTFPDKPIDFHLVYGANEAGKSSLLRAIRDLFFGIHGQSSDNFRHDYKKLLIKGRISNCAGEELTFQRRKGNKNTLLDAAGGVLPESALSAFLGSVDQNYFATMFGLGARELHEGAQQLLRGEGDMGQALFSASMGGTPVQKVIQRLKEEAEEIFRGRATKNVLLRPAVSRYKDLLKQSRAAMVSPEKWEEIERELGGALAEKRRLEERIAKLDAELGWIGRCEDALPAVGALAEEMDKLGELPSLPEVSSDFVVRARAARQALDQTQAEVKRLTDQIAGLKSRLQACEVSPAFLAEADALDQLHQDLSIYRDRKGSLDTLREKLAGLEPLLRVGMLNLRLTGEFDALEERRVDAARRLACEEAAETLRKALKQEVVNSEKIVESQNQIVELQADLEALPRATLDDLREAFAVAAEATGVVKTIAASAAECQKLKRAADDCHHLVEGAPDDFEATARLLVPSSATIRRYHKRMDEIQREIASEKKMVKTGKTRSDALKGELKRLQRQGELPTEEALRKARNHRDHGWGLVLAQWKGDGAKDEVERARELIAGLPLEEAFPQTIQTADKIADALRHDADAVAQAEEKRSQIKDAENQVESSNNAIQDLQKSLAESQALWQTEWAACEITARSPSEMEEWRALWVEFCECYSKLVNAEDSHKRKNAQIQSAKVRLAAALGDSEEKEYSVLYEAARKLVQDGEQAAGQRKEMAKRLKKIERELSRLDTNRAQLKTEIASASKLWKAQCVAVGLPEEISPEAGLKLLLAREDLLNKFDEWRELSSLSKVMSDEISQYEKSVSEKAGALGVKGDTTEARESALWRALKDAREAATRHNQLDDQRERSEKELKECQGRRAVAERALSELMKRAGARALNELDPLLAQIEKRDAAQSQIDGLRRNLSGFARGQEVDEFVAKVRAENPDSLVERKSIARREKSDNESALKIINESVFRLTTAKKELEKAGDDAADFRQQAETCAATITQNSARFLRLEMAVSILRNQIEQFRQENQGPLLRKAGALFKAITRDAFSGLGADFKGDVPILVGLRQDATKVPVEGLSDGTRDQLYLALRLAALDRFLEAHEPMPLILDDLLITFDNDRALAILPQLGRLAERTQIFLFTHHEHLVELCRQALGGEKFHSHRLEI